MEQFSNLVSLIVNDDMANLDAQPTREFTAIHSSEADHANSQAFRIKNAHKAAFYHIARLGNDIKSVQSQKLATYHLTRKEFASEASGPLKKQRLSEVATKSAMMDSQNSETLPMFHNLYRESTNINPSSTIQNTTANSTNIKPSSIIQSAASKTFTAGPSSTVKSTLVNFTNTYYSTTNSTSSRFSTSWLPAPKTSTVTKDASGSTVIEPPECPDEWRRHWIHVHRECTTKKLCIINQMHYDGTKDTKPELIERDVRTSLGVGNGRQRWVAFISSNELEVRGDRVWHLKEALWGGYYRIIDVRVDSAGYCIAALDEHVGGIMQFCEDYSTLEVFGKKVKVEKLLLKED